MTKKDGDKLREMQAELSRMADDYRPVGAQPPAQAYESQAMGNIAMAIGYLLEGNYTYLVKVRLMS